jgi:hypothetical protein
LVSTSDTVVTAAHCVFNVDDKGFLTKKPSLKVESNSKTSYSDYSPISEMAFMTPYEMNGNQIRTQNERFYNKFKMIRSRTIIEHPYYISDIAILKLASPVDGGIPIPPAPSTPIDGSLVHEMAWTRNEKQNSFRRYQNKLLNRANCEARFNALKVKESFSFQLERTEMCMVESYSGGSSCDRDVGGGVICKDDAGRKTLCGIQTFRLCSYSLPKVIIDVSKFASEINAFARRSN